VLVLHVLVRRVGDGELRHGPHSPLRSVPLSVSHNDGVAGGNLLSALRLASQNGLSRQAGKRSHLHLQIDLLAEREMTAVLQLLQDIAGHLKVRTSVTPEQLRDLMKKTDLRRLTNRMEELAEPAGSSASTGPIPRQTLRMRRHRDPGAGSERPSKHGSAFDFCRLTIFLHLTPLTRASDRRPKRRSASRFITLCRIGNDESTGAGFSAKVLRHRVKTEG
jgi:hypothetical protein